MSGYTLESKGDLNLTSSAGDIVVAASNMTFNGDNVLTTANLSSEIANLSLVENLNLKGTDLVQWTFFKAEGNNTDYQFRNLHVGTTDDDSEIGGFAIDNVTSGCLNTYDILVTGVSSDGAHSIYGRINSTWKGDCVRVGAEQKVIYQKTDAGLDFELKNNSGQGATILNVYVTGLAATDMRWLVTWTKNNVSFT